MPASKEQMNVWISKETINKARRCASVQRTSLNQWVQKAIESQAHQDYQTYHIDELAKDLDKVARRHLSGRTATLEAMLEMAKAFAAEDTHDGPEARYAPADSTRARQPRSKRPSPHRKRR